MPANVPTSGPERDLADLRAALAHTLRMYRRGPGPSGLTLVRVPPDGEIIDEVERLRRLADQHEKEDG
jgi:hypothetical protein